MNKYKIERVAGMNQLVIQGQKGQQISEREYYAVSNGQIPGLLRAELVKKSNNFKLVYNISGYISLREFLFNPLNKQSFAKLLSNILKNLKSMQEAFFNQQYVLLDMNTVMVNPATQTVYFVYVPIAFFESETNLKDFLLSIIEGCSFVPGENTDYVKDYIRILNNGINFSVFDLEEYIKGLSGKKTPSVGNVKKCPKCNGKVEANINFCPVCGMKVNGLVFDRSNTVYNPAVVSKEAPSKPVVPPEPKRIHPPIQQTPPQYASDQQSQFAQSALVNKENSYYSGTVASSYIPETKRETPVANFSQIQGFMVRVKTGERININSSCFKIGKDSVNSDYCISDNNAVSRSHAIIKAENNKFFVADLNSTNKTYLNGAPIYPNTDIELNNGAKLKFANEDFIFYYN